MDRHGVIVLGAVLMGLTAVPAAAQTAGQPSVHWEVANRFRLFAEEKEFTNQVKAYRALTQKSVLEQEHALSKAHARGWAENLGALCYDTLRGRVLETCRRDG